jgi:hypothetical protein
MADVVAAVLEVFQPSIQITPTLAKPTRVELERVGDRFITVFRNINFKGQGKISGTTEVDGFPDLPIADRRVYLIDQLTMIAIDMVTSDADGEWEFTYIDATRKYVVIAFYNTVPTFRAVIADGVVPEVM